MHQQHLYLKIINYFKVQINWQRHLFNLAKTKIRELLGKLCVTWPLTSE